VKIAKGIRPCGAFIFHILIKSQLKFQFWGSYTHIVAPMGMKLGMEVKEGTLSTGPLVSSSMPNFTPIGATCRPCGAKSLKIGLLSNLNNRRFALRAMLPVN